MWEFSTTFICAKILISFDDDKSKHLNITVKLELFEELDFAKWNLENFYQLGYPLPIIKKLKSP